MGRRHAKKGSVAYQPLSAARCEEVLQIWSPMDDDFRAAWTVFKAENTADNSKNKFPAFAAAFYRNRALMLEKRIEELQTATAVVREHLNTATGYHEWLECPTCGHPCTERYICMNCQDENTDLTQAQPYTVIRA